MTQPLQPLQPRQAPPLQPPGPQPALASLDLASTSRDREGAEEKPLANARGSSTEPVPTLIARLRGELSAQFDPARPIRISRAPGRLDVMGGIADYTGSLVCEMPLDRAAAVAVQERTDRQVQVFSFNLYDEHRPCTLRMPLEALAASDTATLRKEFAEPGRKFAGYLAGCLRILHERGYIDLANPAVGGFSIALFSTVPLGAGVSSSAAIEVATMMNLVDHFGLRSSIQNPLAPLTLAAMCQEVENRVVGAPCGIMDQVTACSGRAGSLLKLFCQPHELQGTLAMPAGIRVVGINSAVRHSVGGGMYGKTRCAAFMGHRMLLEKMREMGHAAGRTLVADPTRGYLANLPLWDYKHYFRSFLPERMKGREFLDRFGSTIDAATAVDPETDYHVQSATDHHVHEADRVRNFVKYLEEAAGLPRGAERSLALDKAGHLMYGSHVSYTRDALLGADECDLLVELVRKHEREGFYGAKITGGGSGGTVAVLCNADERADAGIDMVVRLYEQQTARAEHKAEVFRGSSDGAWAVGTTTVRLSELA